MTQTISIDRPFGGPSQIVVGEALGMLGDLLGSRRVIVITDSNLHRHHREAIERFEHIIIGLGETNKTLVTMERVYRQLIEMEADRECFILGFGGGIVTDIAGFAASTYMRGVRFGFVATSLLAQVDASVGGKNGVNMDGYKNIIGTFNQPDFVLCDTGLLGTLPAREFRAGLAEMIKAGVIADAELFGAFERATAEELRTDNATLTDLIARAIRVKADIVERDEREAGERRKLNLGHTFAHAIEKTTDKFNHGEAVAIGMVVAAELAVKLGMLAPQDALRIRSAIERAGLPTGSGIDPKRLLKAIRMDKKRDAESVNLILPTGIGSCEVRKTGFDELEQLLASLDGLPK